MYLSLNSNRVSRCTRDVGRVDCERRQSPDRVPRHLLHPGERGRPSRCVCVVPLPKVSSHYTPSTRIKKTSNYTRRRKKKKKDSGKEYVVEGARRRWLFMRRTSTSLCAAFEYLPSSPVHVPCWTGNFPRMVYFFFLRRFLNGAQSVGVRLGNL